MIILTSNIDNVTLDLIVLWNICKNNFSYYISIAFVKVVCKFNNNYLKTYTISKVT